ncbi:MAG: Uma2 family endonuclease [Cyanobacteria bacterium P01_G01_bin.19]
MLISADLPINRNKFSQQDQILTLTGATWADYQQFESDDRGYRVAYFNGEITIVSPGRNHERIAAVINRLIVAYCEKYNISDFPFGQTRLNVWGQAGREPDLAYAFDSDKDLPDLAVEVVFTSGDAEILKTSYQNIGVPKLWIWQDNQITFYTLEACGYTAVKSSQLFNRLESASFVEYVNRGITESPAVIKQDFLKFI